MPRTFRIVVQIDNADPFWVQLREAVLQRAQRLGVDVVSLESEDPYAFPVQDYLVLVEELLAQEIDAVVCIDWPESLAGEALQRGIPVIQVNESHIRHPLFVSPIGLYDVARDIGNFVAQCLAGQGKVLAVGGLMYRRGEDGQSRVAGLTDALRHYPDIELRHVPSLWTAESADAEIRSTAWSDGERFDALVGFSDTLALAGRDAGRELGLLDVRSLVIGINGDPLALAAILDGSMTATVQTSALDLAGQAMDLALQAACKQPLPAHFGYNPSFVTAENVNAVAAQKLTAIASLPSRLMGDNRRQTQQRLAQLETSLRINHELGALLDRQRLSQVIADLIRVSYGYDIVMVYLWDQAAGDLVLEGADHAGREQRTPVAEGGLLAEALLRNEPIFIPDAQHSHRFRSDPDWPDTRSRVIVPIRLGPDVLGLLDLHSRTLRQHARQDLIGLQSLADQMGLAMRNAELYGEAVKARALAEKADQLKTRLLANVSHELRTPLNVILGYASAPRALPGADPAQAQQNLLRDLQQIYASGEHLLRVINDLLDLSRAEINELDLFPELIDPRAFLADVFRIVAEGLPPRRGLAWRLRLPDRLPVIQADPVRLRQILLNLLNNAHKFTSEGEIILGAEVAPPHLHLWVQDTGAGIPIDLQERIFEPFVTSLQARQRGEGVGLGLSITRRLVLLHGGTISLESQPDEGSTFHLYFPLPSLSGRSVIVPEDAQPVLVVMSASDPPPAAIRELSQRRGWTIQRLQGQAHLAGLLKSIRPVALAWDLAGASLDDWNLIQAIRALPHLATLPFILYGTDQVAAPGSGVGLTNYLVKPLSQQTLLDTINGLRPAIASGPVLIVDDDPQVRALYADLVMRALPGYTIRTAESGAAALALLAEETPALAILHLRLPDVDGFKILEAMRAQPATRRVPVVIMSGRTLSFDDVRRLDHMYVTFHNKQLLSQDETAAAFHQALAGTNALPANTSLVVKHTIAYLHQNYHLPLSRQAVAATVGVSKDYLSHIFSQELGLSPWEYLSRYRIQQAKALLRTSHESITVIAAKVGFEDLSYFSRVFRKHVGASPKDFRDHSAGP